MGQEKSSMFSDVKESFTLDSGVIPCMVEALPSKCPSKKSHPRAAPSPSVNSVRGGKTRGRDEVE